MPETSPFTLIISKLSSLVLVHSLLFPQIKKAELTQGSILSAARLSLLDKTRRFPPAPHKTFSFFEYQEISSNFYAIDS